MADPDEMVVLVGGVSGAIPGSARYACKTCGAGIWVAPSGQKVLAAGVANRVLCMPCAMAEAKVADEVRYSVLPDAILEFQNWRKRN